MEAMRAALVVVNILVIAAYLGFRGFATLAIPPLAAGFGASFAFFCGLLVLAVSIAVLILSPYRRLARLLTVIFVLSAFLHWWVLDSHNANRRGNDFVWFVLPEMAFSAAVTVVSSLYARETAS